MTATEGGLVVGVDVGGTFTDIVVSNPRRGSVTVLKQQNYGYDPSRSTARALDHVLSNAKDSDIDSVTLGTTVVTNAVLEDRLAPVALVLTKGFRDILDTGRMRRASAYDLRARRPKPLVRPQLRFEIDERLDHRGEVVTPLKDKDVASIAELINDLNVETIAVCLLHSYVNSDHERKVAETLSALTGKPCSISSDVLPVFGEYERMNGISLNAGAIPIMSKFLESSVGDSAVATRSRVTIMSSDGGALSVDEAERLPARTILSGPAGGVAAATVLAKRYGYRDAMSLDVGGTSTDTAYIEAEQIVISNESMVGGYPLAFPAIDLQTIGAGGGSIASTDSTGFLKVGPSSAGADPGPVCYGRGGVAPTVTDAYVALSLIGERSMLDGSFVLNSNGARAALAKLGEEIEADWRRTAQGVIEVVVSNIARAIRAISVERGRDPRGVPLIAFGGAGPLHAVEVARDLGISTVLVPRFPGVLAAIGLAGAEVRYSIQRTRVTRQPSVDTLSQIFRDMEEEMKGRLAGEDAHSSRWFTRRLVEMRYAGQSYTLMLNVTDPQAIASYEDVRALFEAEHDRRYGFRDVAGVLEAVTFHVSLVQRRNPVSWRVNPNAEPQPTTPQPKANREVWLRKSTESFSCPVYDREGLAIGDSLKGQAIIEQYDSIVVLGPGDLCKVLEGGDMEISVANANPSG